jgi:hypothetical protein
MPQERSDGRSACRAALLRATQGAALAALFVCANTAVVRAGDDDNNSILSRIERSIGLKNPNTMEYGINYSERSPLVVPPTRDLPAPQAAAPPPVADWPKDPDITRREKSKAEDKVVPHTDNVIESGRVLRPDELNPGGVRTASSGSSGGSPSAPQDDRYPNSSAKKSIFNFDWLKKEEYTTFTGEPARTSLTEPPPGYLTPSPDQPYGITPDKKQTVHVPTPSEHGELTR